MHPNDNQFLNQFKLLEKLCNEMYEDVHGVSLYIEECEDVASLLHQNHTQFVQFIHRLRHCRYIRNRLSHEITSDTVQMSSSSDIEFLQDLYSMISEQTDPLTNIKNTYPIETLSQPQVNVVCQPSSSSSPPASDRKPNYYKPKRTAKDILGDVVPAVMGIIIAVLLAFVLPLAILYFIGVYWG